MIPPGSRIGSYEVLDTLGVGGMGVVYRARHVALQNEVAIKVLLPNFAASPGVRARFRREGQVQANLLHPNIVRVVDLIESDTLLAIAMDLVRGPSLEQVMASERPGPWTWPQVRELLIPITCAVALAHRAGVVHRDLKPGNILLDRSADGAQVPRVTDFGVAKLLQPDAGMTRMGSRMGSIPYMAPEQYEGALEMDARIDVHALGMLAWRLLTGRLPVNPESMAEVHELYTGTRPLPRLNTVAPDVPAEVATLIASATARDPAQRIPNADVLLSHLKSEVPVARPPAPKTVYEPAPAPVPTPAGSRRRVWVGAALALVAVAAVLGLVLLPNWTGRPDKQRRSKSDSPEEHVGALKDTGPKSQPRPAVETAQLKLPTRLHADPLDPKNPLVTVTGERIAVDGSESTIDALTSRLAKTAGDRVTLAIDYRVPYRLSSRVIEATITAGRSPAMATKAAPHLSGVPFHLPKAGETRRFEPPSLTIVVDRDELRILRRQPHGVWQTDVRSGPVETDDQFFCGNPTSNASEGLAQDPPCRGLPFHLVHNQARRSVGQPVNLHFHSATPWAVVARVLDAVQCQRHQDSYATLGALLYSKPKPTCVTLARPVMHLSLDDEDLPGRVLAKKAEKRPPIAKRKSLADLKKRRRAKVRNNTRLVYVPSDGKDGKAGPDALRQGQAKKMASAFDPGGITVGMPGEVKGFGGGAKSAGTDRAEKVARMTRKEKGAGRLKVARVAKTRQHQRKVKARIALRRGSKVGGTGRLDSGAVARVFGRRASAFRACYERRLKVKPNLSGKVVIKFTIGTVGRITNIKVASNSTGDSAVGSCIIGKVRSWRFSPPVGGSVTMRFPIVLSKG